MNALHPCLRLLATALLSLAGLGLSASALAEIKPLQHQAVHAETLKEITGTLGQGHILDRELDDALSVELLDAYIERLDQNRLYFLAADIEAFQAYARDFDDQIKAGRLDAAFRIFNRHQQRREERLDFLLEHLESGAESLNFKRQEYLQLDRSEAPWPETKEELDDLWRRQLKSTLLDFKLSGTSLEDAVAKLVERYQSQRHRLEQTTADDAFEIFANTMASLYGPHTQYFTPRRTENFNIDMRLSLEGIGAVLQRENENTKVVRLIPGGPASKDGRLQPADLIVGVAQGNKAIQDVVGWRLDEVVDLIRGPKGTRVRLKIIPAGQNAGQARELSLVRNEVKLEEQAASKQLLELEHQGETRRIGLIRVPTFYIDFQALRDGDPQYRSTTRDVRKLLDALIEEGAEGLVLDLRSNGGGSLRESIELAGLFIPRGPVVQIKDAWDRVRVEFDRDETHYDLPLVVMVNRLSASASEILAGAIKDYQRGLILGNTTFGKGTVQTLQPLDFGQLKLTQATFYRVAGASTQHRGVRPHLQLPQVYDPAEVGESTYPRAIPWSQVKPLPFHRQANLAPLLPELRQAHQARVEANPDLVALREGIAQARERNLERLPLRESELREFRRSDRADSLARENRRRAAKGLPLLKSVEALENEPEDSLHSSSAEGDAMARESARILLDLMDLRSSESSDSQEAS